MVRLYQDIVVGIATCCWQDGLGIESQELARFSTPIQTSPRARIPGLYPKGKRSRGKVLSTHPHLAPRIKKE
jgi:hypothetical protein